jgi:rod shape-determining protein MreB
MKNGALSVGIDLGTSRSAISASNGIRAWTESYVGWPRDFISAKVLGKEVLFGADALEHRLSVDLFRPLERGVIKEGIERNEEAVRELIRHLVDMAKPEDGTQIKAIVGVPAATMKTNKLAIRKAVQQFVHSLMVVSEPFAVAYGLDLLENALVIDIGAGTVDFCIMHGAIPDDGDQRSILSAGDYVDEQLASSLSKKYPESLFTVNMVRQIKEKHSFVGEPSEKVQVELPVNGKPVIHDVTAEVRAACESIMPAIIECAYSMIANFDAEFQNRVKKNIVVAGGGSQIRGIADYLVKGLRELGQCRVVTVQDPLFGGSDGGLKLALDMPETYWERLS